MARKNTLSIGSKRFASDNYYGIIIRDDYEKYISDILDDYFDEFKVDVKFEWSGLSNVKYMSDELNKSISLKDFFEYQKKNGEAHNAVCIYIYLTPEEYKNNDSVIDSIIKKVHDESRCVTMYFYYGREQDNNSIGHIYVLINNSGEIFINNNITIQEEK